ncbi:MAG: hypothetical protein ACJ76F_08365 [Bacteroidia bacterium]
MSGRVIIILISLCTLTSYSQNNYSLKLITDDKLSAHSFSYWGEVRVKSADTSFYYSLHSVFPDVVNVNKPGTYTITCTSVFGDAISKTVKIKKPESKLKLKGMKSYYKAAPTLINLSERMKNNDTLFIVYSTGYPAFYYEKIGVAKKDGKYYAIQYQGLTTDIFQTMQINENQFKEVVKFEMLSKELKPSPSCSNPEFYTLELSREIYSFTDASCNWNGFNNLKSVLFIVEH